MTFLILVAIWLAASCLFSVLVGKMFALGSRDDALFTVVPLSASIVSPRQKHLSLRARKQALVALKIAS